MNCFHFNKREIGPGQPVYTIAEMSCNHLQDFDRAVKIIHAAKASGADAIKLSTETADGLTLNSSAPPFQIDSGTLWDGMTLHQLYSKTYMPWDWQPRLYKIAGSIGLDIFSTPDSPDAVDFLQGLNTPAYKIASFELVDIPLLEKVASTGKPVIMSTGMATLGEIDEAVRVLRQNGCMEIALLKCVSSYPAKPEEMNLLTIPHLAEAFNCVVGLSDHSLDIAVPVAAVALGAKIIEKHFILSRNDGGPDADFSLEPHEFKQMVHSVRVAEAAIGKVSYELTPGETSTKVFRRSLFVVKDMKKGECFNAGNVRCIRPALGLHPRFFKDIIGKKAGRDLSPGIPLRWDDIS